MDAESRDQFIFSRYEFPFGVDLFEQYGPIVYLDTDVICDSSLQPFIVQVMEDPLVAAYSEGEITIANNFYGAELFEGDPAVVIESGESGVSSGILAARDPALFARFSIDISALRNDLLQSQEDLIKFYDQPLVNYLGRKFKCVSSSLNRFVRFVGHAQKVDKNNRLGLVHFAGGPGNYRPKLARMKEYFEDLNDASNEL